MSLDLTPYLANSAIIDWQHPDVWDCAATIAQGHRTPMAIAQACFEWVRDTICHSVDAQMNPITIRASDVLRHKTGYCYAKSHLLAALLRANGCPAGLCYQRLGIDAQGSRYCLHGLNAVYLPETGWYRIDARGNREGVNAQFCPPNEQLAFSLSVADEADFTPVFTEPLALVVEALQSYTDWEQLSQHLPDVPPEQWHQYGLQPQLNTLHAQDLNDQRRTKLQVSIK
jgi:transglutaminase-like putative cysteine protease